MLAAAAAAPAAAGLAACGRDGGTDDPEDRAAPELRAEAPRAEPGAAQGAGARVVPFTARMLGAVDRTAVNAVLSPLSAQIALTMAGLGAAGATLAQMEEALGGEVEDLARSANTLSSVLAAVGEQERAEDDPRAPAPPRASLVSGAWLQEGMAVREAYLDALATHLGSGVHQVDFTDEAAREAARERIDDWVADSTDGLIEDLVPEDALDADTRAVLVDALHLSAAWPVPLDVRPGAFTAADGARREVDMLHGTAGGWYEDEVCRATALGTYGEDLALAVVQPREDVGAVLDAWAAAAQDPAAGMGALLAGLEESEERVDLTMPGVDIAWEAELTGMLQGLGMVDAFDATAADFSGITAQERLALSAVLQKATLALDEHGMEAAAATGVVAGAVSAPLIEHELVLDAPYLVLAYEVTTLAPLVVGWIGDPTQTR